MESTRRLWAVSWVIVCLCASSARAELAPRSQSTKNADHVQVPSKDECQELAKRILEGASKGDVEAVQACIDWHSLLARATAGIEASRSVRDSYIEKVCETISKNASFAKQFTTAGKRGESALELLHVRSSAGEPSILWRILGENDGVSYLEMHVAKGMNGNAACVDVYNYSTGELMSESMHRIYMPLAAQSSKGFFESLSKRDRAFMDHMADLKDLGQLVAAGKGPEALAVYERLPEEVRREKPIQILHVGAARKTGKDEYRTALEELQKRFPNDASTDLMLIDLYVTKGDLDGAIGCIQRTDEALGGDAYQDYIRLGLLMKKHDLDAARAAGERAIEREPTLKKAWWSLLTVLLAQSDHERVFDTLKAMDARFHMKWNDFTKSKTYAEFVKSPWHEKWLQYLDEKH